MMFFVMMKSHLTIDSFYSSEDLKRKVTQLTKMKELGILKQAYVKIAGGGVFILNAESFADVRNAFRESTISLDYDCEIYEINQKSPIFFES